MKKLLCLLLATLIFCGALITGAAVSPAYKMGDADLNGDVEITDVTLIQRHLAKLEELNNAQQIVCDPNNDQTVSITDATLIQRYIAKLDSKLPASNLFKLLTLSRNIDNITSENTLTFSVLSDVHYDEKNPYTEIKNNNISNLGTLSTMTNIDFVANLGDFVIGNEDKESTLKSLNTLLKLTEDSIWAPILNVRGNHDDNGWYSYGGYGGTYKEDAIINDKEWCDLALKYAGDSLVIDKNNPNGGYGYYDHEKSKIRVFVLNSCDIPYILEDDGTYRYSSYLGHSFSNAQLNFVADALMFSDKEKPNEWAALFLTHVPIDTSNQDGERFGGMSALIRGHDYLLSIISAYRKGTAFKMSGSTYIPGHPNEHQEDFMVEIDVDYSKKGYGEVIGFFSGHTHSDNFTNQAGVKNSLSYGYTFIGTSGAEGFNTFVINRKTKTISAFKYGTVYPEKTAGNIVTPPHGGSIENGRWLTLYDQFLPNEKDIYNGVSEIHPVYNGFDTTLTTKVDKETLEVDGTSKATTARQITKAIAVKPLTTYLIPKDFVGDCLSFNSKGDKRTFLTVTNYGDYKAFTTGPRTGYVAFSIHTGLYKDYDNFYVKEIENSLIK